MPIINKGTSFSNGEQLTADKLNNLVDQAEFNAAATDGTTTFVNTAGQIAVASSGISAGKLATNAVETAKILDANVTLPKMATQADQTVIANVSGGVASPTAVDIVGASGILINDDALGTSDTKGATQGNIKAYADSRTSDPARVYNSLTHSTTSANIQQNTTGRPLWVSFTLKSSNDVNDFTAKISQNSDMSSSTQIGQSIVISDGSTNSASQLTMIVPNQFYWQFTHTSTSEDNMVHCSFML